MTSVFHVEQHGSAAIIRLDKPPVNAISFADWGVLVDLIDALDANEEVKTLVIHGLAGRHFSGGNDVKGFEHLERAGFEASLKTYLTALRRVHESQLITIAALHGAVIGGGLMLAAMCDIRLGVADAKLSLPEMPLMGVPGGYRLVSAFLPEGEIRRLSLAGRSMSGDRARELGFIQELHPQESLLHEAMRLAREIGPMVRREFRRDGKALMRAAQATDIWTGYGLEAAFGVECLCGASED